VSTEDNLEKVAAKLDDVIETLEEIESDSTRQHDKRLDQISRDVNRAADAIEEAVDPEPTEP
jgi:hypothetical protein